MTYVPSKDSDQPGHPPSLIRVSNIRSMDSEGSKVSSCRQRRLWSDWADAQADLSLCWVQRSCCWFSHVQAQFIVLTCFKRFKKDRKIPQMQKNVFQSHGFGPQNSATRALPWTIGSLEGTLGPSHNLSRPILPPLANWSLVNGSGPGHYCCENDFF